jgi:uncharacterized MAPEG superfamily protein
LRRFATEPSKRASNAEMATLPYISILLAWVLIYVPRGFVVWAQLKQPEGLDNAHPRAQQSQLKGFGLRAQGAHQNGFEAFAPFAAAVLACEIRHANVDTVAWLSLGFVAVRAVYIALYLANVPPMRSLVWGIGALLTGALFTTAIAV